MTFKMLNETGESMTPVSEIMKWSYRRAERKVNAKRMCENDGLKGAMSQGYCFYRSIKS